MDDDFFEDNEGGLLGKSQEIAARSETPKSNTKLPSSNPSLKSSNNSLHQSTDANNGSSVNAIIETVPSFSQNSKHTNKSSSKFMKNPFSRSSSKPTMTSSLNDGPGSKHTTLFSNLTNKVVTSKSFKKLTKWTTAKTNSVLSSSSTAAASSDQNTRASSDKLSFKPISIFGSSLEQAVENGGCLDPDFPVPVIVSRCIDYIEKTRGYEEIGIYRLSGSSVTVQKLKESFSNESSMSFEIVQEDPHAVTGVLKLFFRELSRPVLSASVISQIQAYNSELVKLQEEEESTQSNLSSEKESLLYGLASYLLSDLDPVTYCVVSILMKHLNFVESHHEVNKMPLSNLIIIFSPCLNVPANVLTILIRNALIVFPVENVYISPHTGDSVAASQELDFGYEGQVSCPQVPLSNGGLGLALETDIQALQISSANHENPFSDTITAASPCTENISHSALDLNSKNLTAESEVAIIGSSRMTSPESFQKLKVANSLIDEMDFASPPLPNILDISPGVGAQEDHPAKMKNFYGLGNLTPNLSGDFPSPVPIPDAINSSTEDMINSYWYGDFRKDPSDPKGITPNKPASSSPIKNEIKNEIITNTAVSTFTANVVDDYAQEECKISENEPPQDDDIFNNPDYEV